MMKQIIVDNQVTPYYITDEGKCFNSKTNRYLKGQLSNSGYLNYNISITPSNKKRLYAHRLVAQFFLNDGQEIVKGFEVNHKDCDKMNNTVNNLEIVTCQQNSQHAWDSHCHTNIKTVYMYDKDFNCIGTFYNIIEAMAETGVSRGKIVTNVNAKHPTLTSEGHYWSYNSNLTEKDVIKLENTGKSKAVVQFSLDGEHIAEYSSCGEAKRIVFPEMKRGTGHISECCRGKLKHYKGYIWKYKDDIV